MLTAEVRTKCARRTQAPYVAKVIVCPHDRHVVRQVDAIRVGEEALHLLVEDETLRHGFGRHAANFFDHVSLHEQKEAENTSLFLCCEDCLKNIQFLIDDFGMLSTQENMRLPYRTLLRLIAQELA